VPIVFEEIVGTVEPAPTPSAEQRTTPPTPDVRLDAVRHEIARLARRAARLRAD
jgi:hypothetical protein